MSDSKIVKVEGLTSENATLLLAAAEELDLDAGVVATTSFGHFLVPQDVAEKAGVDYKDEDAEDEDAADAESAARADLDVLTGDAQKDAQRAAGDDVSGGSDEGIVRDEDGNIDPEKSKKEALKAEAEAAGLDTSGTKADLAERLNGKE